MDFEYTSSIWISEEHLNRMAKRVASGERFGKVFQSIMASYDDEDFYNCGLVAEAVEKEVTKRVKILLENEIDTSAQL